MRNAKRRVSDFAGFFAEYCAEKSFFGGGFGLALGRYLTDKNVARMNLCADSDYAVFIKV